AETRADRTVAAAERAAERERRAPDALAVADRQSAFAALEAGADGDAAAFALGAGGIDRHVQHRRAHRAHAVDAAVLLVQAAVDVVEAVLERGDTTFEFAGIEADQLLARGVGVFVGLVQCVGVAGGHVVPDRVFAAVGVGGGIVQRVGVAGAGDLRGDPSHLILVQAVQAAAGRPLRTLRTSGAFGTLRTRRTLRTGRAAAGLRFQVGDTGIERGQRAVHRRERIADVAVAAALDHVHRRRPGTGGVGRAAAEVRCHGAAHVGQLRHV